MDDWIEWCVCLGSGVWCSYVDGGVSCVFVWGGLKFVGLWLLVGCGCLFVLVS